MARIVKVKLANGKSFATRWQLNGWHVSDIAEKSHSVTLTLVRGAQTLRRTFANWYVTTIDGNGITRNLGESISRHLGESK